MKRGKPNDGMKREDGGGKSGESAEKGGDAEINNRVNQLVKTGNLTSLEELRDSGCCCE
jgi:hypothetical protein